MDIRLRRNSIPPARPTSGGTRPTPAHEPECAAVAAAALRDALALRCAARLKRKIPERGRSGHAMTLSGWLQIVLVLAFVVSLAVLFGRFIAELFEGRRTFLSPVLAPVERGF